LRKRRARYTQGIVGVLSLDDVIDELGCDRALLASIGHFHQNRESPDSVQFRRMRDTGASGRLLSTGFRRLSTARPAAGASAEIVRRVQQMGTRRDTLRERPCAHSTS
jgi:hypothetical protein